MALQPKDLGGSVTPFPESSVRLVAKDNKAVKLAAHASADTEFAIGTPVNESTTPGTYEIWNETAEAAGRKLAGFIHPVAHTQLAAGETLVVVMTRGDVHRDAVPLPAGELQADLDAALQDSDLKSRGFNVFGLEDVSL